MKLTLDFISPPGSQVPAHHLKLVRRFESEAFSEQPLRSLRRQLGFPIRLPFPVLVLAGRGLHGNLKSPGSVSVTKKRQVLEFWKMELLTPALLQR